MLTVYCTQVCFTWAGYNSPVKNTNLVLKALGFGTFPGRGLNIQGAPPVAAGKNNGNARLGN